MATVIALTLPAGANTGHVFTSQTCFAWSASVTLDNNVTTVRRVEVTTTIPGTTGIVDGRYDTTGNTGTQLIWSANGVAPAAGTVTLTILNPDNSVDYTQSSSLQTLKDCTPSTTTAPPTTVPVANGVTTTVAPPTTETTTIVVSPTTVTLPPTTATLPPPTTATVPPPTETVPPPTTATSVPPPTTPITSQGSTTSTRPLTTVTSGETARLPRTGSDTSLPVLLGTGCLATGAALALWRRRTAWTRS